MPGSYLLASRHSPRGPAPNNRSLPALICKGKLRVRTPENKMRFLPQKLGPHCQMAVPALLPRNFGGRAISPLAASKASPPMGICKKPRPHGVEARPPARAILRPLSVSPRALDPWPKVRPLKTPRSGRVVSKSQHALSPQNWAAKPSWILMRRPPVHRALASPLAAHLGYLPAKKKGLRYYRMGGGGRAEPPLPIFSHFFRF